MINKKTYLRHLLIVKKNMLTFIKAIKGLDNYEWFYYKTLNYLEVIDLEINHIKEILNKEEQDFYESLTSIYHLEVDKYGRLSSCR